MKIGVNFYAQKVNNVNLLNFKVSYNKIFWSGITIVTSSLIRTSDS